MCPNRVYSRVSGILSSVALHDACISYFPSCCDKTPEKQSKLGRVYYGLKFTKTQFIMPEKVGVFKVMRTCGWTPHMSMNQEID